MSSYKYIAIDEEGYFLSDGIRLVDAEYCHSLLKNLFRDEVNRLKTKFAEHEIIVEAFDEPLVVQSVDWEEGRLKLTMPYDYNAQAAPESLSVDEWDRFHGKTEENISFVFTRKAQVQFFDLLDSFTDESVELKGQHYSTPDWIRDNKEIDDHVFWSHVYKTETPRWELNQPSPGLVQILPKLKLPKLRVLILGAGSGNDAQFFAEQGHIVTAVDISEEAIKQMNEKLSSYKNVQILLQDVFQLDESHTDQYDLIFEHTCYCAVPPSQRNRLVKLWRRLLHEQGQLLGVFFAMDKQDGPPYGGSEWEVRERLKTSFQFLHWERLRNSTDRRMGKEFICFAQVKN